jgi:hypothetical protein
MIKAFSIFLLSLLPSWLIAQSFTIESFKWDTIYLGEENELLFNQIDCKNFKYSIFPEVTSKLDGCKLKVIPYKSDITYELTVQDGKLDPIIFKLYSQRLTLEVVCLANTPLSIKTDSITSKVGKAIRGVISIVNCPWQSCEILGYNFRIERNGEILHAEDINGWELSTKAKTELQKITRGERILFGNIQWKCPGDDANGSKDIALTIK